MIESIVWLYKTIRAINTVTVLEHIIHQNMRPGPRCRSQCHPQSKGGHSWRPRWWRSSRWWWRRRRGWGSTGDRPPLWKQQVISSPFYRWLKREVLKIKLYVQLYQILNFLYFPKLAKFEKNYLFSNILLWQIYKIPWCRWKLHYYGDTFVNFIKYHVQTIWFIVGPLPPTWY